MTAAAGPRVLHGAPTDEEAAALVTALIAVRRPGAVAGSGRGSPGDARSTRRAPWALAPSVALPGRGLSAGSWQR
jgi:hypothetical protein